MSLLALSVLADGRQDIDILKVFLGHDRPAVLHQRPRPQRSPKVALHRPVQVRPALHRVRPVAVCGSRFVDSKAQKVDQAAVVGPATSPRLIGGEHLVVGKPCWPKHVHRVRVCGTAGDVMGRLGGHRRGRQAPRVVEVGADAAVVRAGPLQGVA
eukprot:4317185-Prymnesium_polylepis.1